MITIEMRVLIEPNTVGFLATVSPNGKPAVSPKGTSVVLDQKTIIMGNIRSPGTVSNIKNNPYVEINYLDVFSRKAVRLAGTARYLQREEEDFSHLIGYFQKWSNLLPRIRGIFIIDIEAAQFVTSPVYDLGATEEELRTFWRKHYR
jgi:hypothetical protein